MLMPFSCLGRSITKTSSDIDKQRLEEKEKEKHNTMATITAQRP